MPDVLLLAGSLVKAQRPTQRHQSWLFGCLGDLSIAAPSIIGLGFASREEAIAELRTPDTEATNINSTIRVEKPLRSSAQNPAQRRKAPRLLSEWECRNCGTRVVILFYLAAQRP